MSECTHDCGSCSANCSERKQESLVAQPHKDSHIKKVIGVVSGKGGVGKSMVTSMSAVLMNRRGYRSAVLDADITGPSIPQAFGLHEKAQGNETEIFPVTTETGIKVMSVNLLLPDETDPVIWRGPIIAGTAKQFWTDVAWGDVDYMFVDIAPWNRRCSADRFSVHSAGRHYCRNISAGACLHDSRQGCQDGGNDERADNRTG